MLEEIFQSELTLEHAGGSFFCLVCFEDFFGLLNKCEHVTHTEDAASHAVRVKLFERINALTCCSKRNWFSNNSLY